MKVPEFARDNEFAQAANVFWDQVLTKLDPEELKEQVQIFRITKPKVQKKSEDLDDWGEEGYCKILSLQTSLKLA